MLWTGRVSRTNTSISTMYQSLDTMDNTKTDSNENIFRSIGKSDVDMFCANQYALVQFAGEAICFDAGAKFFQKINMWF